MSDRRGEAEVVEAGDGVDGRRAYQIRWGVALPDAPRRPDDRSMSAAPATARAAAHAGEPRPDGAPAIIELRGLTKIFPTPGRDLTVFDNLSCRIQKGSFLSVIGPSGCGKSTLLKIICGL